MISATSNTSTATSLAATGSTSTRAEEGWDGAECAAPPAVSDAATWEEAVTVCHIWANAETDGSRTAASPASSITIRRGRVDVTFVSGPVTGRAVRRLVVMKSLPQG